MERNGLQDRARESKIGWWVLGISGFLVLSFFIAPYTLAPGTVQHVEGRANAIDFYSYDGWGSAGNEPISADPLGEGGEQLNNGYAWSEMNPYAGFIYAFGDLNCHQKHERSLEFNENQTPFCTRDLGIFFGLFLGGLLFTRRGWNRWTVKDTCLSVLPESMLLKIYQNDRRFIAWFGCGLLLCMPMLFDGFYQLLTSYESTNFKRVLTGLPFGFGLGVLMCGMFSSRAQLFSEAGAVILPGNSRFTLLETQGQAESE
jgi:uncharacterized membrane protein